MKTARATWVALALLFVTSGLRAAIVVPGADGSDGALNITANTVIDLSQAVTAQWDANNAANAGKGVYDAVKWAVVFKYSSVNVSAGATVTFTNHPSRAPVVWLVSGNVTIAGTVSLDGAGYATPPLIAEPGPGGFRGGFGQYRAGALGAGSGFGPGAGISWNGDRGNGGAYAALGGWGSTAPTIYGNPSLLPLIGGSGGGGDGNNEASGAGGGGAILIASAETVSITGVLRAAGGNGGNYNGDTAGSGSGGGIRVIARNLTGAGSVLATGGAGSYSGGLGRIRIERATNNSTVALTPSPSILQITDGDTALVWPPSSAPTVQVVSVGGVAAPADPRASFDAAAPDVTLSQSSSTTVVVRTTNVESASQVKVRGTPRFGANFNEVTATNPVLVSNSPLTYDWTVTLPVQTGYSALQVRVVRP